MKRLRRAGFLILTFGLLSSTSAVYAQPSGRPTRVIREGIDETRLVRLVGNTRPEATPQNDRGIVSDDLVLDHMLLQLKRSPEREAAMKQYIGDLHNSQSPNYHQWLTAEQFAEHYGIAQEDVATVTGWLTSHGFTVEGVQGSGLVIDFSGTAGQVRSAYHTEIHNLEVNGAQHIGNMSDPQIPWALEQVVAGVVSLHDFRPKPMLTPRAQFNTSTGNFALVPGDLATIYNFNPLFSGGISGKGQTIMVIEDTDLYSTADFTGFRKTFGLARPYPSGTLTQVHPTGSATCTAPGVNGDDVEAIIDVEWATAAAPNAAIVMAACADTKTTFGGLIALQNVLNGPSSGFPSAVSISYGESESENGATANLAYSNTYAQAVTEGVSIFVSSGDEGAASSDANRAQATHGITVSGFTSTPYNVSVGGTDFGWFPDLGAGAPARTGVPPIAAPLAPRCPTSRRFPGTTPARAECSHRSSMLTTATRPILKPSVTPPMALVSILPPPAAADPADAQPACRRQVAWSGEPVPAMRSRPGRACSGIRVTACAMYPTFRCSRPMASGGPTM